jgi:hypothetical protein
LLPTGGSSSVQYQKLAGLVHSSSSPLVFGFSADGFMIYSWPDDNHCNHSPDANTAASVLPVFPSHDDEQRRERIGSISLFFGHYWSVRRASWKMVDGKMTDADSPRPERGQYRSISPSTSHTTASSAYSLSTFEQKPFPQKG